MISVNGVLPKKVPQQSFTSNPNTTSNSHVNFTQSADTFESSEKKEENSSKGWKIATIGAIAIGTVAAGAFAAKKGWLGEKAKNKTEELLNKVKSWFKKADDAPKDKELPKETKATTVENSSELNGGSKTSAGSELKTETGAAVEKIEAEAEKLPETIKKFIDAEGKEIQGVTHKGRQLVNADGSLFSGKLEVTAGNSGKTIISEYKDGFVQKVFEDGVLSKELSSYKQLGRDKAELMTIFDKEGHIESKKIKTFFESGKTSGELTLDKALAESTEELTNAKLFEHNFEYKRYAEKGDLLETMSVKDGEISYKMFNSGSQDVIREISGKNPSVTLIDRTNGQVKTVCGEIQNPDIIANLSNKRDIYRGIEGNFSRIKSVEYIDKNNNKIEYLKIEKGEKDINIDYTSPSGGDVSMCYIPAKDGQPERLYIKNTYLERMRPEYIELSENGINNGVTISRITNEESLDLCNRANEALSYIQKNQMLEATEVKSIGEPNKIYEFINSMLEKLYIDKLKQ